jgi:hypothetical protein
MTIVADRYIRTFPAPKHWTICFIISDCATDCAGQLAFLLFVKEDDAGSKSRIVCL